MLTKTVVFELGALGAPQCLDLLSVCNWWQRCEWLQKTSFVSSALLNFRCPFVKEIFVLVCFWSFSLLD